MLGMSIETHLFTADERWSTVVPASSDYKPLHSSCSDQCAEPDLRRFMCTAIMPLLSKNVGVHHAEGH